MAEITYSPLGDGQALDAASLNDRFTVGGGSHQGAINDLTTNAPAPGALNANHLPSMFIAQGQVNIGAAVHAYTFAAYPYPGTWAVLTQGAALMVEPSAGVSYDLNAGECKGVLVMADLNVVLISDAGVAAPDFYYEDDAAVFVIEVRETGGGAWVPIKRTLRWVHSGIVPNPNAGTPNINGKNHLYRVPIRALIRHGGDVNAFNAVRVRISVLSDSARAAGSPTVTMRECQLSALVLRSGRS
tara:strand:- start:155 stop:883 length:729 start_codon:yes stop_codon:yes gene_type:complete